jgi:hypothetical protein
LLENNGEYFVGSGDRAGTCREFVRVLFEDDKLVPDLLTAMFEQTFSR